MSCTVAQLDVMPPERAAAVLADCCGSSRWVSAMVARRPFASSERVYTAADEVWWTLGPDDWREAFAHHPRIGERKSTGQQSERGAAWAAGEQSGVDRADAEARDALAEVNRQYEKRFGYIYIVCATGKSADELLSDARARLRNDPDTELKVAAEQQRRITRLRLEKLLAQGETA